MKTAPIPENDPERIASLDRLNILYTPAEERFDRITRVTRRIFDVPIALVSLVAKDVQWFKSAQGLDAPETPRHVSFCGHAILQKEPMVINDAASDPDFADNPLVTGGPRIRFYGGCPLVSGGKKVGTLCIIDTVPRKFSYFDMDTLKSLGAWCENELNLTALSTAQKELVSKLTETERRSIVDPVTRLWNRAGMDDVLEREFFRAQRKSLPMALLHVGVDAVEEIEKRHGRDSADGVLRGVAERIRMSVRPHDAIGRWNDSEFLVFLDDCKGTQTQRIADRIVDRVREAPFKVGESRLNARVSVGGAAATQVSNLTLGKLMEGAKAALYRAQQENSDGVNVAQA